MFQTPDMAPLGGAGTPDKNKGFYDATVDGGWDVPGEPYVSVPDKWGAHFTWWRARMLGGRTNHWGRISLRNGPYDFKPQAAATAWGSTGRSPTTMSRPTTTRWSC